MMALVSDMPAIAPFPMRLEEFVVGESNVSMIAKIAWKYRVKPAQLVKYLLCLKHKKSMQMGYALAASCNSVTRHSILVSKMLGDVTGIKSISGSYAYLKDVLDPAAHGLIAPNKKWCAKCYEEAFLRVNNKSRSPVVSDLLCWSLKFVNRCEIHKCTLSERCGYCFEHQPYLSADVEPGYCHNRECMRPLSKASTIADDPHFDPIIVDGALSSISPKVKLDIFFPETIPLQVERIWNIDVLAKNLRALREYTHDKGYERLAFRSGLSSHTIADWSQARQKLSLDGILGLIEGLGLCRASELFLDPEAFCLAVEKSFNGRLNLRSVKSERSILPDIEAYIFDILRGKIPAESRQSIAYKFGVSKGMLENAFKSELENISKLYSEKRKAESLKAKDRLQHEMNRAVQRCFSKGREPTWERITTEIKAIDLSHINVHKLGKAREIAIEKYLANRDAGGDKL